MAALCLAAVGDARPRSKPKKKREKPPAVVYPSIEEPIRLASAACGLPKFRADVDWPSFRPQFRESFTAEVAAGLCGAVLEGVKAACEGDRKLRPKRLARVRCRFKRESLRLQVERKGRDLWVSYTGETPNLADDMKEWLLARF